MKLQFLGTAAAEGWPGMFCNCDICKLARERKGKNYRARSGLLINDDIMVDFSPDTFLQARTYDIDLSAIKTIFVTHSHTDHFAPGEMLYRYYAYHQTSKTLTVYGDEAVVSMGNHAKEAYRMLENIDTIQFAQLAPYQWHETSTARVLPLLARHMEQEECLLYVIETGGKRLFYGMDSNIYPEQTFQALAGLKLDCAILECTLLTGIAGSTSHCNLTEMFSIQKRLLESGAADSHTKFIASHFSQHNGTLLHEDIEEQIRPHGIEPAYDGMTVEV